jgi:hypothetical protein
VVCATAGGGCSSSPAAINFGDVLIGQSKTIDILVRNTGNASGSVDRIDLTGSGVSSFSYSGITPPTSIGTGSSVTVHVKFLAASAGPVSATATVTAGSQVTSVALSGNGTNPAASFTLSSTSVDFGDVLVPNTKTLPITITNNGTAAGSVTNRAFGGTNSTLFTLSAPSLPVTLNPGASVDMQITFTPPTIGDKSATCTFSTSANTLSPVTLTGSGIGTHMVTVSWDASPSDVIGYNVYRATGSPAGTFTKVNSSPVTCTSFRDLTVTGGTTYTYQITALSSSGESSASNQFVAVVPTP